MLTFAVAGACIIQNQSSFQSRLSIVHKPRLSLQRRPLSADHEQRQLYINNPLPSPFFLESCTKFTPSAALIGYPLLIYILSLVQSGALANAFGHGPCKRRGARVTKISMDSTISDPVKWDQWIDFPDDLQPAHDAAGGEEG